MTTTTVRTDTTIRAWHNDADLKTAAVTRMREHAEHDRLIRGTFFDIFGENGETLWGGCLHGCLTAEALATERGITLPELRRVRAPDWHGESERLWGIPRALGRLLDQLYENSATPAGDLAVQILEAIPVGVDLAPVVDRLVLDLLTDGEHGVRLRTEDGSDQRAAVDLVAELYRRRLAGDEPTRDEWENAEAAATAAAGGGGFNRAAAVAADAAEAATDTAADAAATAAGGGSWWSWWQTQVLTRLATAEAGAR